MTSDWDEIKRLASDFQKAQQKSNLLRLSDQNAIEIVSLLIKKNLVEVVFTNDGKEYVTPKHLETEVLSELAANNGRANMTEISKALNIDLTRIEAVANRLVGSSHCRHIVLGQLIDDKYIADTAQNINERLAQRGELSIADLVTLYDLPCDFILHKIVEPNIGKIIRGRQDPQDARVLFTQGYIQRCKAKLRGALTGITRPTNVGAILQQIKMPERILHSVFDELTPAGQLTSKLPNAQYIPHIYAKTQSNWVRSFYKQNHFLEYDAINKLGISDAKEYIRKQLPNEKFLFLKRIALGSRMVELDIIASLKNNENTNYFDYADMETLFPSNFSKEDIEEIFNVISEQNKFDGKVLFLSGVAFSIRYVEALLKPCHVLVEERVKSALADGTYRQYLIEKQLAFKNQTAGSSINDFDESKGDKREERRRKAASGKAGGGSQGRETKTKSTKKQQRGRATVISDDDDSDSNRRTSGGQRQHLKPFEFIKPEDIVREISGKLKEDELEHLADLIAKQHWSELNRLALAKAEEQFIATPQTNRREIHTTTQERVNNLLDDIRLYEKGLKLFATEVQAQLAKYLLKSIGNDICNELTIYVANESNITLKSEALNADQRLKVIQEFDDEYKPFLFELNRAMNKTIDEFVQAVESALKACSMIVKKIDKRKDRSTILQHKRKLQEQLEQATDHALVLHLVTLLLFTSTTDCILHASGKFVTNIISFLAVLLDDKTHALLSKFHSLLLKVLQSNDEEDFVKSLKEQLNDLQPELKELALKYEKPGAVKVA